MHKLFMKLAHLYLARRVRRRPPRPLSDLDLGGVRRVLLISATALGDTLFSTPAIRALKERFPAWELEVLAHRVFGALLAHNPHVGRIYTYPGRNRRLLTLARDLRRRAYDLVVILHGNDPEATLLAHLTGSPYIIGSARSPLAFAYSATVAPTDPYEHAIERRLNYVRLLGADTADKRMDLFLPPGETDRAAAILTENFGAVPPRLMAFHPTGSDPYKWWPAASFVELGNFLYESYQAPLLIISGTGDREPGRGHRGPDYRPQPGDRGPLSPAHRGRPARATAVSWWPTTAAPCTWAWPWGCPPSVSWAPTTPGGWGLMAWTGASPSINGRRCATRSPAG